MENLILQIVTTDGALRARVAEREAALQALREDAKAVKQEGHRVCGEARAAADAILAQAEEQARAENARIQRQTAQAEQALRDYFEANRAAWTQSLVRHCLQEGGAE